MQPPFEEIRIRRAEKKRETGCILHGIADSGYKEGSPWTAEQYEESAVQEHVHYFLAESGRGVVGFVGAAVVGTEADIHSIAVAEQAKRKGIGHQLLTALVDWLQKERVEQIFLEVRESNAPAIALYKKAGFQPIGKRPKYYSSPTEDAYVMKKQLKGVSRGLGS